MNIYTLRQHVVKTLIGDGSNQYTHGNSHRLAARENIKAFDAHNAASTAHAAGDLNAHELSKAAKVASAAAEVATRKTNAVFSGTTLANVHANSAVKNVASSTAAKYDHDKAAFIT
jgi:hypothetical protein